jgi:hypothetical protein
MKIGLLDIDGHNFPNLALMKISAYHKSQGDEVEWVNHFESYDKVYKSKVFTFTSDDGYYINANDIIKGGTGYDYTTILPKEIDSMYPDYSLYPQYKSAYGFLTRGCPNKCSWCVVPQKEGKIKPESDIEDILQGRESAILMDNNVLASEWGIKQIEKIVKLGIKVDFNQGLDARLIDRPMAELLSKVRWLIYLRMACDTSAMMNPVKKATELLREYGCKPKEYFVYTLVRDLRESYDRVIFCKKLGLKVFIQPFRNFTTNQIIPQWQKDMAHWANKKSVFNSCDFKDFEPRKGFRCGRYFS